HSICSSFYFLCSGEHPDLHSFPTRRSSDLGTTSVVVLKRAIELAGGVADFHVPDRLKEGYGMQPEVVESASARGVSQPTPPLPADRKSTRLNSSHVAISYAVFCLKKKKLPL